jgi:hypothetical protein
MDNISVIMLTNHKTKSFSPNRPVAPRVLTAADARLSEGRLGCLERT